MIYTIFITAGLDIFSKSLALSTLDSQPRKLLGSLLQLHLVYNSGAAFSIATNKTTLLSAFSRAVATLILIRASRFTHRIWILAAGLVVGGITGNLIDRIFRAPGALSGQVIDWIELPHWPTFNLADTSIVSGAILAAILVLRNISPQNSGAGEGKTNRTNKGESDE